MSSFYYPVFTPDGFSGPTGPTGHAGPYGAIGPTGTNVYGPTGSSIIGLTFESSRLLFTYEDGSTKQSNIIRGATGAWQARITGTSEGFTESIFLSASQSSNIQSDLSTYGDVITFRNFKTNTTDTVGITLDVDTGSVVVIKYIASIGVTFDSSSLYEIVIGATTNGFTTANATQYDNINNNISIRTRSYLEGITNVFPTSYPGTNTHKWDIDTDNYSVFQLRLQENVSLQPNGIINIQSTVGDDLGRGISIIIPHNINYKHDKYKYTINDVDENNVKFPFMMPPTISSKLDVINMISVGSDTWYGNFAIWNTDNSVLEYGAQQLFGPILSTYKQDGGDALFQYFSENITICPIQPTLPNYTRECIPSE